MTSHAISSSLPMGTTCDGHTGCRVDPGRRDGREEGVENRFSASVNTALEPEET